MKALRERWSRFWFAPAATAELAACRIAWSASCLLHLSTSDIGAGIDARANRVQDYEPLPILSLLALPFGGASALNAEVVRAVLTASQIAGWFALVGLGTRVVLPLFALASLLVQSWAYSFGAFGHDISLLQWALLLLAFSPCGAAWSADAWIARATGRRRVDPFEPRPGAAWPLRLVHVLIALGYLSAGMTKLARGPGEWLSGYTLQYYVSFHALRSQSPPGLWLMRQHGLLVAGAWFVVFFETSFLLSIWFRRWAWLWAAASILVHTCAYLFMGVLFPSFPALCLAMLPWRELRERVQQRRGGPLATPA